MSVATIHSRPLGASEAHLGTLTSSVSSPDCRSLSAPALSGLAVPNHPIPDQRRQAPSGFDLSFLSRVRPCRQAGGRARVLRNPSIPHRQSPSVPQQPTTERGAWASSITGQIIQGGVA